MAQKKEMPKRGLFYHLLVCYNMPLKLSSQAGRLCRECMQQQQEQKSCPSEPDSLLNSNRTYAGGTSLLPPGMESALCTIHKKVPLITDYGLTLLVHGAVVHNSETNGFSSAGFLSGHQLP